MNKWNGFYKSLWPPLSKLSEWLMGEDWLFKKYERKISDGSEYVFNRWGWVWTRMFEGGRIGKRLRVGIQVKKRWLSKRRTELQSVKDLYVYHICSIIYALSSVCSSQTVIKTQWNSQDRDEDNPSHHTSPVKTKPLLRYPFIWF